jgi:hypothetical protein
MPIGILGSLAVCTVLYVLFSYVLTGVAPSSDFVDPNKGMEASVAWAIKTYMTGYGWLATLVTVAILAGFSSVMLVMLLGQSRVFYTMAKDGLLPTLFSDVHPKFRTPYKCNAMLYVFVGLLGGPPSRRHHRQSDIHRNAVCVCFGKPGRLDHAPEQSRSGTAIPNSVGTAGADSRGCRLQCDDYWSGHDHPGSGSMDGNWPVRLLPLCPESQQAERTGH